MIRFIKWAFVTFFATIVFVITGTLGFIIGQFKYLFQQGAKGYLKYLTDMIGGIFYGASYILEGFSIGVDIMANAAGGEGLEVLCTKQRSKDIDTLLGNPEATISAGIGDTKNKGYLDSSFGRFLDKGLNIAFNQKDHGGYALDLYNNKKHIENNIEPYFKRKR